LKHYVNNDRKRYRLFFVFAFLALLAPATSRADCADPVRAKGAIVFNDSCKVLQYCDGTDWILIGHKDPECDFAPDAFGFTDQTDVAVSTQIESNIVQITGISTGTAISIAGDGSPQYRICADGTCSTAPAYTGSAGTIDAGEYVQLRLTSSASNAATLSATLTIGTGSDQWDVTTEAAAPSGPAGCPNIADQCDDNSIYIGEHPTEAGVKLYATDVNQSTAIDWSTAEYGGFCPTPRKGIFQNFWQTQGQCDVTN
jgi:hypothetical protein